VSLPPGIDLRCGDWREVLADVGECDALITDPPYSERTHAAAAASRDPSTMTKAPPAEIPYACWSDSEADHFAREWSCRCRGWVVLITSHDLARVFEASLLDEGRYVFAPVPWVAMGSRIRLAGDGPSNWACWIVVARPRSLPYSKWGTLPGAYLYSNRDNEIVGGKPLALMRSLVKDYSRPGDLVCDPCAGMATTLIAAAIEGRRSVGSELDPSTHARAMSRIARGFTPLLPGLAA